MSSNLIVTTPGNELHPLAFQGILVYTCFPQIREMLRNKFGDEFVLLFAQPVVNTNNGEIDWYTPVQGTPKKLAALPPETSAPIYEKLSVMAGEIHAYAQELINSGEPLKVTRGNILERSLHYPDSNVLYAIGEQPVYTCWGFTPGTPGAEGQNLAKVLAAAPKPAPLARPVEKTAEPLPVEKSSSNRPGCALWGLSLVPLLLLLALLFGSFGRLPPLLGYKLFDLPQIFGNENIQDKSGQIAALEEEVRNLKAKIGNYAEQCQPPQAQKTTPPQQPDNGLVIPEDAVDTSFLDGRWLCETGLANNFTGEPIKVIFSFDTHGKGRATVIEPNDQCQGAAHAVMQGKILHIELDEQKCARSKRNYGKTSINCQSSRNKATQCKGINYDGTTWNATFYKLR